MFAVSSRVSLESIFEERAELAAAEAVQHLPSMVKVDNNA